MQSCCSRCGAVMRDQRDSVTVRQIAEVQRGSKEVISDELSVVL